VIRNLSVELKATKPAIGKVELDLFAQPPLRADAVTVANNKHADQQFGVDRGAANLAIEPLQLRAQLSQNPSYDRINPAQKMTFRNASFEIEEIKQLALIDRLPTHHHLPPPLKTSSRGIMIRR
jgi:hypothetical protein